MTCCPSDLLTKNSKDAALTLFRWYFGVWFLYVGLSKWFMIGPDVFQGYLLSEFSKTWITPPLLTGTSWIILLAEPILGAWLILGYAQKQAWILTSLLLFMLTFGMTVKMDPTVVYNWIYLVFSLVALSQTDACCRKESGCSDTKDGCK